MSSEFTCNIHFDASSENFVHTFQFISATYQPSHTSNLILLKNQILLGAYSEMYSDRRKMLGVILNITV